MLHISTRQLNRYKPEQRLSPEQSNFLYEVTRMYTRALDVLGDKATAEHWLEREQLALGNHTPLQMLDTTEGVRLVDDLLWQIEYGFYLSSFTVLQGRSIQEILAVLEVY